MKVRFDPEKPGGNGFRGKNHYQVHNPAQVKRIITLILMVTQYQKVRRHLTLNRSLGGEI